MMVLAENLSFFKLMTQDAIRMAQIRITEMLKTFLSMKSLLSRKTTGTANYFSGSKELN